MSDYRLTLQERETSNYVRAFAEKHRLKPARTNVAKPSSPASVVCRTFSTRAIGLVNPQRGRSRLCSCQTCKASAPRSQGAVIGTRSKSSSPGIKLRGVPQRLNLQSWRTRGSAWNTTQKPLQRSRTRRKRGGDTYHHQKNNRFGKEHLSKLSTRTQVEPHQLANRCRPSSGHLIPVRDAG
jgi:hypothetical protein